MQVAIIVNETRAAFRIQTSKGRGNAPLPMVSRDFPHCLAEARLEDSQSPVFQLKTQASGPARRRGGTILERGDGGYACTFAELLVLAVSAPFSPRLSQQGDPFSPVSATAR